MPRMEAAKKEVALAAVAGAAAEATAAGPGAATVLAATMGMEAAGPPCCMRSCQLGTHLRPRRSTRGSNPRRKRTGRSPRCTVHTVHLRRRSQGATEAVVAPVGRTVTRDAAELAAAAWSVVKVVVPPCCMRSCQRDTRPRLRRSRRGKPPQRKRTGQNLWYKAHTSRLHRIS